MASCLHWQSKEISQIISMLRDRSFGSYMANAIRFLPPLNVKTEEINQAVQILDKIFSKIQKLETSK